MNEGNTMQFDIFINPPEGTGGKWKAFSMAFPGCKGSGNTKEEAIRNFKISMEKCINALINILPEENNNKDKGTL
jgi:predicted RNase H-like HicB family nuclease